jgi:hypothetical protein
MVEALDPISLDAPDLDQQPPILLTDTKHVTVAQVANKAPASMFITALIKSLYCIY